MSEIKTSYDYESFKFLESNRDIDWDHVHTIKESIRINGWLGGTILVDKNKVILDGQHRYWALRELSMEIPYSESPQEATTRSVIALNTNAKNWNLHDYIRAGAKDGLDDYIYLQNMLREHAAHSFSPNVMARILNVSPQSFGTLIKDFEFTVHDREEGEMFLRQIFRIKAILKNHPHRGARKNYRKSGFVTAVIKMYKMPQFRIERLENAMATHIARIAPAGDAASWTVNLIEIYNHKLRKTSERLKLTA